MSRAFLYLAERRGSWVWRARDDGSRSFFFFLRVEKIRKKEAVQSVWPRVHHYNRAETAQHYAAAHPIRKSNGKSSITAGAPYFPKTYANIDSISRLSTVHNYIH